MPDPIKPPEAAPPVDPVVAALSAHDQAMLAKADTLPGGTTPPAPAAPPPAAPTRPDDVPEKFWDASKGEVRTADLLKSYRELEASRSKPTDPPPTDPAAPPAGTPPAGKVDFVKMAEEVSASGTISEDSIKALEAVGFDKSLAERFIAGEAAQARLRDIEGFAIVGGEQPYTAMLQWASTALSAAEQEAFNAAVSPRSSSATMKMAIEALQGRYSRANGSNPALVTGGGGGQGGAGGFASTAEMTAAMRDPRYRNDTAYRAEVERRAGITNF